MTGLPRVEAILPPQSWPGDASDRVVLDYDNRFRRRIALKGVAGTRFLLDLPEPRLLMHGEGLQLEDGRIVAVDAAAESLAEITCANETELMRVAWHLGNRHLATQIMGDRLRIREDHVIVDMVQRLGAHVAFVKAPFQPEGGAYGHGAVHGHDHGPNHHDDHLHDHNHGRGHNHGAHDRD